jgi:hypothetical protein
VAFAAISSWEKMAVLWSITATMAAVMGVAAMGAAMGVVVMAVVAAMGVVMGETAVAAIADCDGFA